MTRLTVSLACAWAALSALVLTSARAIGPGVAGDAPPPPPRSASAAVRPAAPALKLPAPKPAPPPLPAAARLSPKAAYSLATADARGLAASLKASGRGEEKLGAYRYFWFTADEPRLLADHHAAFQAHVNFLSRFSELAALHYVHPQLVRIDTDVLGWDRGTLEAAQHVDVFFTKRQYVKEETRFKFYWPGGTDTKPGATKNQRFQKQIFEQDFKAGEKVPVSGPWLDAAEVAELQKTLYTQVPVLCAEWFLVQSCKQISPRNDAEEGLGYYDFLQLKDREDFFKLVVFDQKGADRLGKAMRAAQEFSKVSTAPRQFLREQSQAGPLHVALDTAKPDKAVAIRDLKAGQFDHQIEEWYGTLANELFVTFLSNEKGVRVNNAPADLAGFKDDSTLNESRDGRIHVHLACLRCHEGAVLKPIDDWVRQTYGDRIALADKDEKATLQLQREYFSDIAGKIKKDKSGYQEALQKATVTPSFPLGLEPQRAVEVYARAFHWYNDDPVSIAVAARELGTTEAEFQKRLEWLFVEVKVLDTRLAPFLAPLRRFRGSKPLPISRLTWEGAYELAQDISHGIVPELRKP